MRKAITIYSELSITRESPTITCVLSRKEKVYSGKMEGFRYELIKDCWHEEASEW